jgi:GAF domain-containing protein
MLAAKLAGLPPWKRSNFEVSKRFVVVSVPIKSPKSSPTATNPYFLLFIGFVLKNKNWEFLGQNKLKKQIFVSHFETKHLMAENLFIPETTERVEIYEAVIPQIEALISSEADLIANLANISAALKQAFGFYWVGFYLDNKSGELVLGPFQGPIACTRIRYDKGVCGHSFSTKETVIVPDVDQFPGHIACSSASKSEIVVPLFNSKNEICGVLDVDSDLLDDFSELDKVWLEKLLKVLGDKI